MKTIWGLFWAKEKRQLKTVAIGTEADIPVMHQPIDCLHRELAGVLLELLCQCDLDVFICL
jgi:hypothetical protein